MTNLKEAVEGRRNLLGDEHHMIRVIVDALAEPLWRRLGRSPRFGTKTPPRR